MNSYHVRLANWDHAAMLEGFCCVREGEDFERVVQWWVQQCALAWAFDPHAADNDPRVLLVFDESCDDIVAIVAHERVLLTLNDGEPRPARSAQLLAVGARYQGTKAADGNRWSDIALNSALIDARIRDGEDLPFVAVVHRANRRGLALFARHGLTHRIPLARDQRYFKVF